MGSRGRELDGFEMHFGDGTEKTCYKLDGEEWFSDFWHWQIGEQSAVYSPKQLF